MGYPALVIAKGGEGGTLSWSWLGGRAGVGHPGPCPGQGTPSLKQSENITFPHTSYVSGNKYAITSAFLPACNGFLRFTSDATPADLLMASIAAGYISYIYFGRGRMLGFEEKTSHAVSGHTIHSATATGYHNQPFTICLETEQTTSNDK